MEVELGIGGIAAAGAGAVIRADIPHRRNVVAGLALRPPDTRVQPDRPGQELEILLVEALHAATRG